ncbi:MAG: energy-coupling factor transporter transmembrane component T, partial [Firmicutes bacterium]|nr:energy-coupling factor transporter transmembrane component T [Bacillota bacterium]
MEDAFSKCHPAVNFLFFAGAIGFGVVIQHPAYLLAAILAAAAYYLLLSGRKGWKMILALLPMLLFLTAINPLLNHYGKTVLFRVFGKPYTLEALVYGGALSGIFGVTLLWFGCYNKVLTSDKFTSLFGNLIPALSLLLVMVLRMIPNLIRKAGQISGARNSVGKGTGESAGTREKLNCGMMVLGALTSWALEGSLVTADSMRARGYGAGRRSSFRIHR